MTLCLVLLLAATGEPTLAAPGLQAVKADAKVAELYNDYLAQQLGQKGVRVTTRSEVTAIIGFERQKQLLGCSEQSSQCIAELANALGVDGLVIGNVAHLGKGFVLTLKVLDARGGRPYGDYSARLKTEDEVLDWLTDRAAAIAEAMKARRPVVKPEVSAAKPAEPPVVQPKPAEPPPVAVAGPHAPEHGLRRGSWIPAAVGVAALGVGLGLFISSKLLHAGLLDGTAKLDAGGLDATLARGQAMQLSGVALFGLSAAAIAAAALLFFLPTPSSGVSVGGVVTPGSAWVGLQGAFP